MLPLRSESRPALRALPNLVHLSMVCPVTAPVGVHSITNKTRAVHLAFIYESATCCLNCLTCVARVVFWHPTGQPSD